MKTSKLITGVAALALIAGIGAASAQTKPQDQKSGSETAPAKQMQGTGAGTGVSNPQAKPEDQKSGGETSPKKQREGN